MKLWEKGYTPDQAIEKFTVGKDPILDLELLPYDLDGSIAHAAVLNKAGVLSDDEKLLIENVLEEIRALHIENKFTIEIEDEDCHTAIENHLIGKLGNIGKKIHTARSRNDQVLTALRLLQKDKLNNVVDLIDALLSSLEKFARTNGEVPMPGFTHTRKAMPFSVGDWITAFADSLKDDLHLVKAVLEIVDQNPLGTGAGYGVPFPLDRGISTEKLNFASELSNPLYAQNSRGKIESSVMFACSIVLNSLNRWASDLILFTMPGFDYFSLDDALTTGSSIMPHKKNPDVLELIRSSVHQVTANQMQIQSISLNLISGYHRDVQLSKEPLLSGLKTTLSCLEVSIVVMNGLSVNKEKLEEAMSTELFSVQKAYDLVQRGVPFREAYKIIAEMMKEG